MSGISPRSLRSSLLAGVVGLTAVVLLAVGAAGTLILRSYLLGQVDEQLTAAATAVRQTNVEATPDATSDPALKAYITVTSFLIEARKADGTTVRLQSTWPLPRKPLLDRVPAGDAGPMTVAGGDGSMYRVVTVRSGGDTVLVGISLDPVYQTVKRLILTATITSLTALLILVVLARLLVIRRLRPLDEIAATATALADGELDRRVPAPDAGDRAARTEVGRLSVAINGMLARIQAALAARARSEQRMREFVADASHELRTPVTSIRGYLQLVRTGVVDLRERPDVLRRLEEESTRMGALVTDLLYLARLDAEPALRRAPVDLARLVGDAVADARAVEPDRAIAVTAPATAVVSGDADALRQVLANLLGNVRAHTPAGTLARVVLAADGDGFRLTVADDGPGMSPEAASQAFDRFWRADPSRAPNGGAGLGLAIVAEAVRAHDGRVGIEPAPGGGTAVWFVLPRSPAEVPSNSHPAGSRSADGAGDMAEHRQPSRRTSRGPSLAALLHRLGLTAFRHRFAVVAVWIVVFLAAGLGAATLAGKTVNTFNIPGQESTTALTLIGERFGSTADGATAQVVLAAPDGSAITDVATAAEVEQVVGRLKQLPGVASATNPLDPKAPAVSADGKAAYSTVTYGVAPPEVTPAERDALRNVVTDANAGGLTAAVSGTATQPRSDVGGAGEIIGVVVALLVLALTYGSLVAAGMNLVTAAVGVAIGSLGITTLTGFIDLQSTTPILAIMLGLAVGIDYALFIFTRFRHELRQGRDVRDAVAMAVGTAGSAVVTAGLTVVIALAGLFVAGIPFLTEMGLAAAGTVVIAVLVATTLVPAVLSLIGRRALPRRVRNDPPAPAGAHERGFYRGWATTVSRRSWLSLAVAVIALGVVALPVFSMQNTLNPDPARGSTQAQAARILSDHFGPGVGGPLLILVDGAGAAQRAAGVSQQVATLPDVARATAPRVTPDGTAALITVIPGSAPNSAATEDLVHTLRDALRDGSPRAYVTGTTAVNVDVSQKLSQALPIYLLLVVGLALVLLVLVFRSILVPVTGVLGFLLTIGASLGATTAVFQWGWLAALVRSDSTGPLMSLAPIIVTGILFGLAMDYQVFLVSRMHEAHARGAAPRVAVVTGFRQAAPVVLAAASIMFAVFAGFVPQGDATIKPIAFALAIGILFDAVVVRLIAMPAALTLLGRAAWWLPRWLRWLPTLDVEGSALHLPAAEESPATEIASGSVADPVPAEGALPVRR